MKVLVVDDEEGFRDHLAFGLSGEGHDVETASSGREAIDVGSRYRPDLLIADWMLKRNIHGLHVAEALRLVRPELQTILITGFASRDLKSEADELGVFEFIEKPFDLERIHHAVRQAAGIHKAGQARHSVAVVVVDAARNITYANGPARELFAQTHAGRNATTLAELFAPEWQGSLEGSKDRWVAVSPRAQEAAIWRVRSKEWHDADGRLFVLLSDEGQYRKAYAVVRMLLGLEEPAYTLWPFEGRALIVDGLGSSRRDIVAGLEEIGCVCHAAESNEDALRLLERDDNIHAVVLDYDAPGGDLGLLVEMLSSVRPEAIIVGTGAMGHRDDFAEIGVERFLVKPWKANDLVNLLTGRIGDCVHCGLPTPLRRAGPDEVPSSWVCSGCGCRYSAVLDDRLPPDMISNVRPAGRVRPAE